MTTYLPGYSLLSVNTTCGNNVSATKSSKLRFLSGNVRRSLQNTTNTTNGTNTTTPPAPTYFYYSVCPTQNYVCSSDNVATGSGTPAAIFNATVASFIGTLNSAANWKSITGTTQSGLVTPTATNAVLQDNGAPNLVFNYTFASTTAMTNLTVVNTGSPSICAWAIANSGGSTPAGLTIYQCNGTSSLFLACGMNIFNTTGVSIIEANSIYPTANTAFNIYFYCTNNVVGATNFANVNTYAFTYSQSSTPNNNITTNNITNNGTNNTSTTNGSSASYIAYGFAILMTLVFIL